MKYVIRGATLVGRDGRPLDGAPVLVVNGALIAAVGEESDPAVRDAIADGEVAEIDGRGRTAMPGLFDCHVHFIGASQTKTWPEIDRVLYGVEQGTGALSAGITTARDVGSRGYGIFALREKFANGSLPGPRVLASGAMICMTGGHGCYSSSLECDGPEEVRKGVRTQIKAGANWIKVAATGGASTPNEKSTSVQLDEEEMHMAVHEASKAGIYVCAHAHAPAGIKNAVRAGVRTIEHGVMLDREGAEMMAERGVWLCPTASAYRSIVERGPEFGVPDYMQDKARAAVEAQLVSLQLAREVGVGIAFGTDTAGPYNRIGRTVAMEAEMMADAGYQGDEIAVSATSGAAEAMGVGDVTGALEPGFAADVVLFARNPLESPSAYGQVDFVMASGVIHKGERLVAAGSPH